MGRSGQGKPQKSKKNKKIKSIDPFFKGPSRNVKEIRINEPPSGLDKQEIPKSVREIECLKKQTKQGLFKKRKNKTQDANQGKMAHLERGMSRPLKHVPEFKQRKGESELGFLNRMERESRDVLAQTKFEETYDVDLEKLKSGENIIKKRKVNPKKMERLKERKKKLTEQKVSKQENRKSGFEHLHDKVQFGEVAMEPPSLTAKPRKGQDIAGKKAGSKSLLLKQIMQDNMARNPSLPTKREVGKTLKRKMMSPAQQHIMDNEREKAIQIYRVMKAKRMKLNT